MTTERKHWSEIGRVENSDWFRKLPKLEQQAVIEALEERTHESALRLRVVLAVLFSAAVYGLAGLVWGVTFQFHPIWCGIAGGLLGLFLGALSANAIASQKTPKDASAMQATTGLIVGLPGFVAACLGLLVLLIRLAFAHSV